MKSKHGTGGQMKSFVDRDECPMRHENGNCTVAGGFCTAVNDPICEALHNAFYCGERSKLDEYKKAEAEGRLAVLPCKLGDTVYRVIRGKNGHGHISPATVSGLHLGDTTKNRRYRKEYEYVVLKVDGAFCAHVNKKDFGKTVFLTREEAEKALED